MRVQEPLGVQPHEQYLLLLLGIDVKAVVNRLCCNPSRHGAQHGA